MKVTYDGQSIILAYSSESQLESIKKTLKDLPNIVKEGDPLKELTFWKELLGNEFAPSKIKAEWGNVKRLVNENKIDFKGIEFEKITF